MTYLRSIGGILMEYARNNDEKYVEYGRITGGIKLFRWIGMDMHECALIDEDGYGGVWRSVDGCEYIWI